MAPLDREKIPAYNLIARATDGGGRFCQSEIHLILEDVNDNPPVFSSDHYTACVYENTATKALLTRVQATDPDVGKRVTLQTVTNVQENSGLLELQCRLIFLSSFLILSSFFIFSSLFLDNPHFSVFSFVTLKCSWLSLA